MQHHQLPAQPAGSGSHGRLAAETGRTTLAAPAGQVHSAQQRLAAALNASPRQRAVRQAAPAQAAQRQAAVDASSRGHASTCTERLGRASPPAAGQPLPQQDAAAGSTGWRPAKGHAAIHIRLKDVEKRAWVPQRVLSIPFGGSSSIPMAIDLFLLAPDSSRRLCTVGRTLSKDGLEIRKSARTAMQQQAQQETLKRSNSTDSLLLQLENRQRPGKPSILVLQRMECDGMLSPVALGVRLLADRDATPAITAEADYHADAKLVRRHGCNSQPAKRRRLAPAAEPATQTVATAWLTLDGSPRAPAAAAAAAVVPRSGDSTASPAAAGQPQQREQPAVGPSVPPKQISPQPAARQHSEQPAVTMTQTTAGTACLRSGPQMLQLMHHQLCDVRKH